MNTKEQVKVKPHPLIPQNGDEFDVIIIGAGPAGMAAAVYSGRARLKVLVIDKALPGGQMVTGYRLWDYPGFPGGVLGCDLAENMETQMYGYSVYYSCEEVDDLMNISPTQKVVKTDLGHVYTCKAVIIAVGLEPKMIKKSFEQQFLGRGISYFAQCDAESYKDQPVAVIGGGTCACYAANFLSEFVGHIYMIHRSDKIDAVTSIKEKVLKDPKISIIWNSSIVDVFGIDHLEKIKVENDVTHQHTWIDVKAAFIYIGRKPPQSIVSLEVAIDEAGHIITDDCMRTNIHGVYAAGDIRSKQVRQVVTAVSDGMIAAINLEKDILV
jgi:thioredoxin reductase (NADPH)